MKEIMEQVSASDPRRQEFIDRIYKNEAKEQKVDLIVEVRQKYNLKNSLEAEEWMAEKFH